MLAAEGMGVAGAVARVDVGFGVVDVARIDVDFSVGFALASHLSVIVAVVGDEDQNHGQALMTMSMMVLLL